jgi:7-keto-8-aminopelargonate synthetase-like enzyme
MEVSAKQSQLFSLFNSVAEYGVNYLEVEDESLTDEFITVKGKKLYNFGNCGYLALEQDERVKESSIDFIRRYGSFYPSSRSFASLKVLSETEEVLEQIFERPILLGNTTGLCHIAAIPLLADKNDIILADKQVHKTVTNAILMAKAQGTAVETVPHNNLANLEEKIINHSKKYNKVWFMADSIYSMFGDSSDLVGLRALLDKYDQFYLYLDDAHGMSWAGKNGSGYLKSQIDWHPKLIMATSFQKGFGAFGAGLVLPDEMMKKHVKYLGSIFIFSGPPTPATLGAIAGAAKIHLTDEIYDRQNNLIALINHFIDTCSKLSIPLVSKSVSPVLFVGVGDTDVTIKIGKELIERGFFVNCCAYPAVPIGNSGLRITLSLHHSLDGVTKLLTNIAELFNKYELDMAEIMPKYKRINQFEGMEV